MKYLILWTFLSLPVTWTLYRVVMWLQRWRDAKPRPKALLVIAFAFVEICKVFDYLANVYPTTILFWDFQIEGSISQRLRRLVKGPDGWRKDLAVWSAEDLLNPYSNGGPHIPL